MCSMTSGVEFAFINVTILYGTKEREGFNEDIMNPTVQV